MTSLPDPIPADSAYGPCLIVAWISRELALIVDMEGTLREAALATLKIDWRYNATTHEWIDAAAAEREMYAGPDQEPI